MLESIHIESYRTLRNTSVEFRDGLNIIIGQNGVGKSNLLEFIKTYTSYNVLRFFPNVDLKGLFSGYTMLFSYVNSEGRMVSMEYDISKKNLLSSPEERNFGLDVKFEKKIGGQFADKNSQLSNFHGYATPEILHEIWTKVKPNKDMYITFNLPNEPKYLSSEGTIPIDVAGGVNAIWSNKMQFLIQFEFQLEVFYNQEENTNKLGDLKFVKTSIINKFEESAKEINLNDFLSAFTNIEQVRLNPNINVYKTDNGVLVENLVLQFKLDGAWMPWSYLSDGTKRSFYLIAELAQATDQLILIEEPEIGLHPFQLQKVMTFLKEQSASKQIILSTHSPQMLNILEPDELDQILIASISKGRTSFNRLTDAQKKKAKMYMTEVGDLSDYWLHSDLEQEPEDQEDAA
ncbi:MAG: AAA family ATPase [Chitinophagaceae bacterium]